MKKIAKELILVAKEILAHKDITQAAFVDSPFPMSQETEDELEQARTEAEEKLNRELTKGKGEDYWEPGRTLSVHFALTGIPMFREYGMTRMTSLQYRNGILTVNPEWYSTKDSFNSYSWAPLADKMIQAVKQSQKITDMAEDTLKRIKAKLKLEIPRNVKQDIVKWIERAAERRLTVHAFPSPKGKEFVINELELVGPVASRVAKIYPETLYDADKNRELWGAIKNVADEVWDMVDEDETGTRSQMLVRDKARFLSGKYRSYYTKSVRELQEEIEDYIWETYHEAL